MASTVSPNGYTVYTANVQRFAGQIVELDFTVMNIPDVTPASLRLDDIRFSPIAPQLTINAAGDNIMVTWPTNFTGFALQSTTNLASSAIWSTNLPAPVVADGQYTVTNPISGTQQFFRLIQ